jgi:alanine dehydrogenase
MIIGVPREVKDHESRVGLVPYGVSALVEAGHEVVVQSRAGALSSITDDEYLEAGARIAPTAADVWHAAEIVVKVKEPQPSEYGFFRENLTLFTYLHLAPEPELTKSLLEAQVTGIAYETIQEKDGALPCLIPMSEVAGRMASQVGAQYLEAPNGGRGVLLAGIPGVAPANVVVLGGGIVGHNAAKIANGLGANVTIIDRNLNRLRELDDIYSGSITTLASNTWTISESLRTADLVIGAVLIPGASAPKLVRREMLANMKHGAVMVDVAIDQGGCFETSHGTTHTDPVYYVDNVLHYCVTNMPAAVPHTSTYGLTNATFPFLQQLASKGVKNAIRANSAMALGVNTYEGKCTFKGVAEAHGLQYTDIKSLL